MSYCRWSSMDWACDVYVYEDCGGGWTTHVAGRRREIDDKFPKLPQVNEEDMSEWIEAHNNQVDALKNYPCKPIGLPHDGESFNDPTPLECANRLETLRGIGYNVPQYAIDALRDESHSGVS